MADISKITLPSGNTYEIKDAVARQMISGGVSFIIAWDGTSAPVAADIPAGVKVTYNSTTYTGTLAADNAEAGAFYLVKSGTAPSGETLDVYDEYVPVGTTGSKTWEKIGDTQLNLTDVVTGITLTKQTDTVLGTGTTFSATSPTVAFNSTTSDTFVKSVSAETNKSLVTTTVPNVTDNTSVSIPNVTGNTDVAVPNITGNTSVTANKSTWTFTMGSGAAAETLIIGGGNGSDVSATNTVLGTDKTASKVTLGTNLTATNTTLGTAKTVATGETSTTGTGAAVVTGVTVGDSASAITGLGSATVGTISVTAGTNDQVTALTNSTDVSVTKGN